MRKHMTRAGVAMAALASLGMGGGLVVSLAAPAGAAQPGQTITEVFANTETLVNSVDPAADSDVQLAVALACFPLELVLDAGPPYPPPGSCDLG